MLVGVSLRQSTNGTDTQDDLLSFEGWLSSYWYVLLIVLFILVVICFFVCAYVLRKHPWTGLLRIHNSRNPRDPYLPDGHGGSSEPSPQSSLPTMPSSSDSTPIPSPQSSQQSMRTSNDHAGSGRNRRTSPHLSSTSSDTLRPDSSSNSSVSLMGQISSPTRRHGNGSPMERRGSVPRRTSSGPMVRVTSMPDVKNTGGMQTAPSTISVESSSSGRSGVSYKFKPINDSKTFVEVGVTVHTPGDPDKAVRIATAAALAESARKLAQEAASFIDSEEEVIPAPMPNQNRFKPSSHPVSGRVSSLSLTQSPYSLHTPTHLRSPSMTTASLDHPSLLSTRGNSIRGEYPLYTPSPHYPSRNDFIHSRGMQVNDSDYHSYYSLDSDPNLHSNPGSNSTINHSRPTCIPGHSSLQRVNARLDSQSQNLYRLPILAESRNEKLVMLNSRDSPYSNRHMGFLPISKEFHDYHQTDFRRNVSESSSYRKIPYYLKAAGRRQSAPIGPKRAFPLETLSGDRRVFTPLSSTDGERETSLNDYIEKKETKNEESEPSAKKMTPPDHSTIETETEGLDVSAPLTRSTSTSTGLSSTYSSQIEDPSPHPSQDSQALSDGVPNTNHVNESSHNTDMRFRERSKSYTSDESESSLVDAKTETETQSKTESKSPQKSGTENMDNANGEIQKQALRKDSTQSSLDSEESIDGYLPTTPIHGSRYQDTTSSRTMMNDRKRSDSLDEESSLENHLGGVVPLNLELSLRRTSRDSGRNSLLKQNYIYQSRPVTPPRERRYHSQPYFSSHPPPPFSRVHPSPLSPPPPPSPPSAVNVTVHV